MTLFVRPLCLISLLLTGALFGFFYAWVCSTMWGLDGADPRVAVAAMQAMNASVRNAVFAPAFFGTPVILLITTITLFATSNRATAMWFGAATLVVALLGVALTMAVNVPMNEALAALPVPEDIDAARVIWQDYSPAWQFWNQMRTIATGVGLLCVGVGMLQITPR
ncbi:MAG: anthrone oxygenase family protein [Sulfitobacter sp.]